MEDRFCICGNKLVRRPNERPSDFKKRKSCCHPCCIALRISTRVERALNKILKTDTCWIWQGLLNANGYGVFCKTLVHRLIYEHYKGKIPEGLCVLHKCDNPQCVNPEHLFVGTRVDNIIDMCNKKRQRSLRGETHGSAKLKDKDILRIKYMLQDMTCVDIAKVFNVSAGTISHIKNGLSWKHLRKED